MRLAVQPPKQSKTLNNTLKEETVSIHLAYIFRFYDYISKTRPGRDIQLKVFFLFCRILI